ncbi:MAG: FtsW/RodA/SpoVE family cell cycle protein [Streptococcaceae bacterium]|jgi:rod shape determining protein RodA|nr:FtsW/RodA/SpoVE family cell cycle protein [Streptococcaceae bacterium]
MDLPRKKFVRWDSRIDYALILPVFLLSLIGFIVLSISLHTDYNSTAANALLWQQGAWLLLGLVSAFIIMHFNAQLLWFLAPILYGLGLVLMVLPLIFYSPQLVAATGSKNWIAVGGTTLFQPSEPMKVAYVLFQARLILRFRERQTTHFLVKDLEQILWMFLATVPVLFLLIGPHMQSDFGTALVFVAIFSGMIMISGVSWKILLPVITVVLLAISGFLYVVISKDGQAFMSQLGFKTYQFARFQAWLHPFSDPQGTTYQQAQALLATASGGTTGAPSTLGSIAVPVRESDMIFTVIAGLFGFVGSSFVIFLYLYLIYRMVRATFLAKNQFYMFVAGGLTMMLLFHVFENIGATIGVLPLTGIPLPFISQGGSNLISNMMGIGIILSIRYTKDAGVDRQAIRARYRKKLARRMAKNEKKGLQTPEK